jgi:phosphoenolpyruvate carboxylase
MLQNPDLLRRDIRFLGRLLGAAIKTQDGDATFDRIEEIRQASVKAERGGGEAASAGLERLLGGLILPDMVRFVHSFACFLQMANIAEDQAARRSLRAERSDGMASADSLEGALERLSRSGVPAADAAALLDQALIAPVITAHPTEVRRKSVIDRVAATAALLDTWEASSDPRRQAELEQALMAEISILWETRLLRTTGLGVRDEIENAVSYFERVLLDELPRLYADWRKALAPLPAPPSFLKIGTWVGGDRDGNPNVTAEILRYTFARQSAAALERYLTEINALGAELSIASPPAAVTEELALLAEASGDNSVHRRDEPYRRALSGVYARASQSYVALVGRAPPRASALSAEPYARAEDLRADLTTIHASLVENHGAVFEDGRLARLIRAVDCFGFHLARVDVRQNSKVHERVISELLATAGACPEYLSLDEDARVALLIGELSHGRLLSSPFATYTEETRKELDVLGAMAEAHARYGPQAITRLHQSPTPPRSRTCWRSMLMLKEVGLFTPGDKPLAPIRPSRCSRPSTTCAPPRRSCRPTSSCR